MVVKGRQFTVKWLGEVEEYVAYDVATPSVVYSATDPVEALEGIIDLLWPSDDAEDDEDDQCSCDHHGDHAGCRADCECQPVGVEYRDDCSICNPPKG